MTTRVTVNIGFITNSSSCINCFPKELLDHADVKEFISKYGLSGGYVGSDIMMRSEADSFLVTAEDKRSVAVALSEYDYEVQHLEDEDTVTVIYSDEYDSLSRVFCDLLSKVAKELGMTVYAYDYN